MWWVSTNSLRAWKGAERLSLLSLPNSWSWSSGLLSLDWEFQHWTWPGICATSFAGCPTHRQQIMVLLSLRNHLSPFLIAKCISYLFCFSAGHWLIHYLSGTRIQTSARDPAELIGPCKEWTHTLSSLAPPSVRFLCHPICDDMALMPPTPAISFSGEGSMNWLMELEFWA
jgi:hypothetical protein